MSEVTRSFEGMCEALGDAWLAFRDLDEATTIYTQGKAMEELFNRMHDLISWHPDFDIETGEIAALEEPTAAEMDRENFERTLP